MPAILTANIFPVQAKDLMKSEATVNAADVKNQKKLKFALNHQTALILAGIGAIVFMTLPTVRLIARKNPANQHQRLIVRAEKIKCSKPVFGLNVLTVIG